MSRNERKIFVFCAGMICHEVGQPTDITQSNSSINSHHQNNSQNNERETKNEE